MDWIHEKPRQNRFGKAPAAIALSAGLLSLVGIAAYAQSRSNATGKAQVIERRGPQIALTANSGGQVVVLFPQASQSSGAQMGDVEVVLVESQQPAAVEGQPQAAATPTGREVLFSSRDANDGLVRYTIDQGGNARQMMVLARVGGKYVEARQTGGGEGVTVLTVQQPAPEVADPGAQQGGAEGAAGSPTTGEGAGSGNAGATAQQQGPPPQAAIIMIYAPGSAR